jgi:myosin III
MPFRLDEIPFFDTSMLCEPADLTFFTTFEEEIEPWDAPLRRRNNVSSQISSKLYNYPRRESHYSEIGSDDGVLIMEPFSRDPTMPLKKIRARKYESPRPSLPNILDEPVTHTFSSPTPYSPPNFSHLKSKFSGDTNGNIETKVFKKRAAPKPPSDDHVFEQRPSSASRKGPAPQPFQQSVPLIREMESYGKSQLSTTDENDEPPFNFQAMLRKTKYNRNSMKRNNENRMSLPQEDQLNNNTGKIYKFNIN